MRFCWRNNKIQFISWSMLAALALIYFLVLYYTDIYATYRHSLMFLDCLNEGKILEFYEVTFQDLVYGVGAYYLIPIYVIFAAWNFPVWIFVKFFGFSVDSIGCLLWSKGIVLFFSLASIWIIYLILHKMKYEHLEYALYLFASSLFFFIPVLAVAQYDVIHIFLAFSGFYLFILDGKLSWRSLALFSIAISIKFFALFPFLILVLLSEKRIGYIIGDIIFGSLFSVITILPWYSAYRSACGDFNDIMIEQLLSSTMPGGIEGISLFVFGFCIILLVAFLSEKHDMRTIFRYWMWMGAVFFILFFASVRANPYWIVMLLPFLIPVVIEKRGNLKINMILEIIVEGTIILVQGYHFLVYFSERSFSFLLLKNTDIKLGKGAAGIGDVMDFLGLSIYLPGIYAVFIVCAAALLYINNPWKPFLAWGGVCEERSLVEGVSRFVRIGAIILYIFVTYMIAY